MQDRPSADVDLTVDGGNRQLRLWFTIFDGPYFTAEAMMHLPLVNEDFGALNPALHLLLDVVFYEELLDFGFSG